jgi:Acetoacetate decarboxylase (ADC)
MEKGAFSKADAGPRVQARHALPPAPHAAPSGLSKVAADPADLVARALAILDDNRIGRNDAPSIREPTRAGDSATPSVNLQLQRRILSDGTECSLPIRYFDVQCLVATYLTEPEQASSLLKGAGLRAVLQEDGKAVVDLYCIEYRKTDIGPYNEVGLTVLAEAPGDPIPASYVVNLPVTTRVANRAGREIWGYNKFVAAIDVASNGKKFSAVLRDEDSELICSLDGERGDSVPEPASDILTFTMHRGRLMKTVIRVLTPSRVSSGHRFSFKVGTSKHPMTSNLRALALDRACPALIRYSDPFQALLFPGQAL